MTQLSKQRIAILLAVLLGLVVVARLFKVGNLGTNPDVVVAQKPDPSNLTYTKHARCRMDCRNISEGDVLYVLANGVINKSKSDANDKPCPSLAMEGKNSGGDDLRIVFAQCDKVLKVVTVINLDKEFDCHCPGD